jgi:hypothetical protein
MQSVFPVERLMKSKFEARKVCGMNAEMCQSDYMGQKTAILGRNRLEAAANHEGSPSYR